MQFLQLKTQEILSRLNSVNKNKFNENEYLGFIKNCKIYDELRDDNLKEIFKVLQKMSDDKKSITKQQFQSIMKKLNNSIIYNKISLPQLNEDQLTLVIENLKIIHGDFSLKREVSDYQKNDYFNFILNNNFESKVLTVKVLDTYPQNNLSLLNLKNFYEKLEKQIIYDQTQIDESQLTSMNQSQMYQSQLSVQEVSVGFLDKVRQNIQQIIKLGNFQDMKLAQANQCRDTLLSIIPEKFNYLKKQIENEQDKFNDSEMKLVQKEQKIKTLCNHLDSREIELNSLENEIRELKQEKMVLQNQLRGKESYCDQQEDKYNKDIQKLVDQLENENLQIKQKEAQIKLLESQYDEVRRMYETSNKSLEEVRKKSNQVDQATFDLIKYKNEAESLQNQLQLYKQRQDNLEEDYRKLLEQKNQQDKNFQEECETLREKILNLEKEKIELERQVNDNINMSLMGSMRDSVRDSNIVFDNYDSMIDIKRRLAGKDDIQDLDMTNQLDLTNDFNPILENTINQNVDDQRMSIVQNNLKEFQEQKKLEMMKKDEELQIEREKNNKLEKQVDKLEQQLENHSRENAKLKQNILELESQNKIFLKDKENLMKDIEVLAKEKDDLKSKLKTIQDSQQNTEKDQISKQNDELLLKLQIIKQKDEEISKNKNLIDQLQSRIKNLNLEINSLKDQLKIKDTQLNKLNQQLVSSNQQQKASAEKQNLLQQQLIMENQKNLDLINKFQFYNEDLQKYQNKIKKMNKEIQDLRDENKRKSISLLDSFQFDQKQNNQQFGKESILIKDPKLSSLNEISFDEPKALQTQQNNIFSKKKKPMVNLEKSQNFQMKESMLIQNIISKNKTEETDNVKKDNKLKTYSYDHIEVARKSGILKIITQYQSCKSHASWFSDLVTRVNSRNHHTSKILVVTEIALFIFSNQKQLKKKIELLDIQKIIHNKTSNYICICQAKERDVLQVLRKDELLLFIRRKLKSLKSKLKLVERHQLVKQDYFHNLQAMNPDKKKFGKEFNNTIQIASRLEKIVMVKIDKEGVLFDSTKEILALITDFGIICLSKGSKKVVDFMPLGEAQLIKSKKANVIIIEVMKDKKRFLTFISQKERDLWFNKIENCQINLMKLNEQV